MPERPNGLAVPVKLLNERARLPQRAYEHDAAFDLCASESVVLAPQSRVLVHTGIALGLPAGVAALTLPRSGLAARHGIALVNAPGLIDPGYRGEIMLILLNTDTREAFSVHEGDRVAQLLIVSLPRIDLVREDGCLAPTSRGERGFGSSGLADTP